MARLPRKNIPLPVKLRVVLRQLGEMWPDEIVERATLEKRLKATFDERLEKLRELLGGSEVELHLDHDPPLGAREKIRDSEGVVVAYVPDELDPECLIYREKRAHEIKTNVRGDGAQYPDRVKIKRQRRRERLEAAAGRPVDVFKVATGRKRKFRWPSRPFAKGRKLPTRRSLRERNRENRERNDHGRERGVAED
jgi:hypothetical protein